MNVPKLRFFGFKDDFKKCKLGKVLFERKEKCKISEDTPLLAFAAGQGVIDRSERRTNNRDFLTKDASSKTYILTKLNDIVYNPSNLKYGAIDRNKHGKGVISPIYVTFETNQVPSYIELIVTSPNFKQRALQYEEGTVTKRQSVKPENLLDLEVSISNSQEEQFKVGEFFQKIDKKIKLQQEKIDLLKEQKKGFMQKIFSQELRFEDTKWKYWKLSDLAQIRTGKAFSSEDFNINGKYLVITNKNIQDEDNGKLSVGDHINLTDQKLIDDYLLNGDNILVTMDGVNIGKVGKINNDRAVLAQRVGRINSNQFEFIYQVLSSDNFLNEMNKLSVGNAIKHISLSQIADYEFLAPIDPAEQKKIGLFLSNLDNKIQLIKKQVTLLKEQKQAFMQQMFI